MHMVKALVLCLGLLGIADTGFVMYIAGGMNLGTFLPGIGGAGLVAWAAWFRRTGIDLSFLLSWNYKTAGFVLVSVWALSFVAVQAMILYCSFGDADREADCCILLGAGLRGKQPTLTLHYRIVTATAYLNRYPKARIIVSGGQGPKEVIPEAECMRRRLEESGIAPERIIMEDQSTSTMENLRFSKAMLAKASIPADARIGVISSDFHLLRVRMLAKRLGMKVETISAPSPWYLLPNTCIREYFALVKSFVSDWPAA